MSSPGPLPVALALGLLALAACGSSKEHAVEAYRDPSVSQAKAVQTCEMAVKSKLRSPSTAKFPRDEIEVTTRTAAGADGRDPYDEITKDHGVLRGDFFYMVHAAVDAVNGFGAVRRDDFYCYVAGREKSDVMTAVVTGLDGR